MLLNNRELLIHVRKHELCPPDNEAGDCCMAPQRSPTRTLMTAGVCVWARAQLIRESPVRTLIDSLSGAAERPGPVNLFSQTLHPYL